MQLYKEFIPRVSVILPTYNRVKYLSRAINSVLNQIYENWELIVVDDGSDDSTYKLINSYQEKFEKVRYMRHQNRRTPLTLNIGILAAAGYYITFLGSDDEYKKEHLSLRMDILEKENEIDLLHGGVEIIGDPFVKDKNDLSKKIHLSECVIGGTLVGKKETFLKLGGFRNLNYSDDSDFYERALPICKIREVDFPTYIYYRDTPDSICTTITQ